MATVTLRNIKAISFDLDDTLYDNKEVIINAFRALYDYFQQHFPNITNTYNFEKFLSTANAFRLSHPLVSDLNELRRLHINHLLKDFGYTTNDNEVAFNVFWQARQAVTLYPNVIDVLTRLAAIKPLVVISNGTACIKSIGIDRFFQFSINASDAIKPKPDADIFLLACEKLSIDPEQLLHIGDSLEIDVNGAHAAGCRCIWFNPSHLKIAQHNADVVINDLSELLTIHFIRD